MSDQDPVYDLPADDASEKTELSAREMRAAARAAIAEPDRDVSLAERAPILFEQYRRPLLFAAVALVVLLFGGVLYYYWHAQNLAEEKARMAGSERLYEQAMALPPGQTEQRAQLLNQALATEATRTGLKRAADDGDLIGAFYAANAYYELGQYNDARTYFGKIGSGHGYVTASARAGEAAILENQSKPAEAAAKYLEAADADDSKALAPQYLLAAARAFVAANNSAKANEALDRLERDFADAPETGQAGLIRGMAQAKPAAAPTP
ncbi:MAG: hypothetical protein IAE99_03075 [Rhodothermales bacterium]|nr:hypothetical protein [Rhodothermales bacterium]